MFALPLFFYVCALGAYTVHFARRAPLAGRIATTLLVAGALAHTFVVGMQTMEAGHLPFAGTTQAISTFVWLLALAYLYTEMTTDERSLGHFHPADHRRAAAPAGDAGRRVPSRARRCSSIRCSGRTSSALLGAYASFALAAVIGVTYVLQFKEIKAKHLVFFYTRLPSLQVLDVMNSRTVVIGWLLMTIGLVAGALWVSQALAIAPSDPRVQAMSLSDPKIFVALMTWAVYTFQLVARRAIGWRGRRAAYVSAARLRDRAVELRAGQLLPDRQPQLRGLSRRTSASCSASSKRRSSCTASLNWNLHCERRSDVHLLLVGASHRTAPVELRERLDFCSRGLEHAIRALASRRQPTKPSSSRPAIAPSCTSPARIRRRPARTSSHFCREFHQLPADRIRPHLYCARRSRRRATPVPRGVRPRLARRRRAADPRPDQGRLCDGDHRRERRAAAESAVPLGVRRRASACVRRPRWRKAPCRSASRP